jgi:hypothetical protein
MKNKSNIPASAGNVLVIAALTLLAAPAHAAGVCLVCPPGHTCAGGTAAPVAATGNAKLATIGDFEWIRATPEEIGWVPTGQCPSGFDPRAASEGDDSFLAIYYNPTIRMAQIVFGVEIHNFGVWHNCGTITNFRPATNTSTPLNWAVYDHYLSVDVVVQLHNGNIRVRKNSDWGSIHGSILYRY